MTDNLQSQAPTLKSREKQQMIDRMMAFAISHVRRWFWVGLFIGVPLWLGAEADQGQTEKQETAAVWAHEVGDMPPDPNVIFGRLENGFRYVLMRNMEPRERVSIRLWVNFGSLYETDDQRGLAHFLEHMAFVGTENF